MRYVIVKAVNGQISIIVKIKGDLFVDDKICQYIISCLDTHTFSDICFVVAFFCMYTLIRSVCIDNKLKKYHKSNLYTFYPLILCKQNLRLDNKNRIIRINVKMVMISVLCL